MHLLKDYADLWATVPKLLQGGTMKLDLQLKIGFFFAFILMAAGCGILTQYRIAMDAQQILAQTTLQGYTHLQTASGQAITTLKNTAGQGMENVFLVTELQAAFLDQMLQWKNFLVRGEFKDTREKYLAIIKDGDSRISTLLAKVQEVFQADPEGLQLLDQIVTEYQNFQKQAAVGRGMITFQDTYVEGIRAADQYAGDKGVATIGMIGKLARHAADLTDEEFSATAKKTLSQAKDTGITVQVDITARQQETQRKSLVVATGTGIVVGLVFVVVMFFLRRTVINPILEINERLRTMVATIVGEADQLLEVSTNLVSGAGQQTASLEETGASIEILAAQAAANCESARQGGVFSAKAQEVVAAGEEQMIKMIDAMQEIGKASSEVIKITKNIDEIAFTANLLSLNAAIEAARAGQAGAGFSIIVDEIKNFSRQVAAAAQEAKAISENANAKIRQGSLLCESLENAFAEINQGISQVDAEIHGIAVASNEQALGVKLANSAISEIERVSSTAASRADAAARMSAELTAQALELDEISATLVRLVKNRELPTAASYLTPTFSPDPEPVALAYESF
jgi:methyl-accepting chemotaxis protein